MENKKLVYDIDGRTPEMQELVKQAKEFILNSLAVDEEEFSKRELKKLKLKLMDAVKIVMTDEMGIKADSIDCIIDNGVELPDYSDASWQLASESEMRKGSFGKVLVAQDLLENSVIYEFLRIVLHEFGHASRDLKAERTENYPEYMQALDVDEDNKLDRWLFLLKHQSDIYEYEADMFSFSKIQSWLREADSQGRSTSQLFQNKKWAMYGEYKRHLEFAKCWALRFVTAPLAVANGLLKNRKYSVYYTTNADEIYARNIRNQEKGFRNRVYAEKRIRELREQETLSDRERFELADLYALYLAKNVGVEDERIGVVVGYDKLKRGMAYLPNEGAEEDELVGMIVLPQSMLELSVKEFDSQIRATYSTFRDSKCVKEGKKLFIWRFRRNGETIVDEQN